MQPHFDIVYMLQGNDLIRPHIELTVRSELYFCHTNSLFSLLSMSGDGSEFKSVPPLSHKDHHESHDFNVRSDSRADTGSELSGFSSHRSHHSYSIKRAGPYLEGNLKLTETM